MGAWSLVSVGAASQGAAGAAVTPAWATGAPRAPGNLLVLLVAGAGAVTVPGAPAGWSTAVTQVGSTAASAGIFYRIASGANAAPTVALATSQVWAAVLAEFAVPTAVPLDQTGGARGTGTIAPTAGAADAAQGELVLVAFSSKLSSAATVTVSSSFSPGAAETVGTPVNNSSTSIVSHYWFNYWLNTTVTPFFGEKATITPSGGTISEDAAVIASFKPLMAEFSPGTLNPAGRLPGLY